MRTIKNRGGFTLIESLLYIGILSIALVAIVGMAYTVFEANERVSRRIIVEEEANFILRKLAWAMNNVQSVDEPAPDSTSSTLVVSKRDFLENPLTFSLTTNGILMLQRQGGTEEPLNSEFVPLGSIDFKHIPQEGPKPAAVETVFTINNRTYEATHYLR